VRGDEAVRERRGAASREKPLPGGGRRERRLLLVFRKTGLLAFLSHLETMRALERALRRAGLPLSYSEGFSPHPRLSSSPALPVGVSSEGEYLEVRLCEEVPLEGLCECINRGLPADLQVVRVEMLPPHFPKMSRWARYALYRVDEPGGGRERSVLLALPLAGAGEGKVGGGKGIPRLRDALEALRRREGWREGDPRVTRVGLYATLDEVLEEAPGGVLEACGREAVLREVTVS